MYLKGNLEDDLVTDKENEAQQLVKWSWGLIHTFVDFQSCVLSAEALCFTYTKYEQTFVNK